MSTEITIRLPASPPLSSSDLFGWFFWPSKPPHVISLCSGHAYLARRGWKKGKGDLISLGDADRCCVCMGTVTIRRMRNAPMMPGHQPEDGTGDVGCDVNIGGQNEQADDHEVPPNK
jgi:hypothetical protein